MPEAIPPQLALTDAVRTFLEAPRFAVLATINRNGTPQQTVMWYALRETGQGTELVFNTKRGRLKDLNLRRDPRVSLCIPDGYNYVTVRGTARMVDDQETAQADIRELAIRYHGQEKGERSAREGFSKEERVSYYVAIEHIHARLAG